MKISVIIPTKDRIDTLRDTINSLILQTLEKKEYEILIIDQSTDLKIRKYINNLNSDSNFRIRYFYNEIPGLHSSRNIGAKKAKGSILFFTDDDIIASERYLEVISKSFEVNPETAIMTGKITPIYEGKVPEWINYFWEQYDGGKYIWQISLLDLGDKSKEISPNLIFGCNYIIKRDLFIKYKGTNPDAFSKDLIKYSGNSEIALSYMVYNEGLRITYNPELEIQHLVKKERLTKEYFYSRNFFEGIKKSYFDIRKTGKKIPIKQILRDFYLLFKSFLIVLMKFYSKPHRINFVCYLNNLKGRIKHKWWVLRDKRLFEYILQDNYFDEGKEFINL